MRIRNWLADLIKKHERRPVSDLAAKREAVIEAAEEWCRDTEEESGHHSEWKALSGALDRLKRAKGGA